MVWYGLEGPALVLYGCAVVWCGVVPLNSPVLSYCYGWSAGSHPTPPWLAAQLDSCTLSLPPCCGCRAQQPCLAGAAGALVPTPPRPRWRPRRH